MFLFLQPAKFLAVFLLLLQINQHHANAGFNLLSFFENKIVLQQTSEAAIRGYLMPSSNHQLPIYTVLRINQKIMQDTGKNYLS